MRSSTGRWVSGDDFFDRAKELDVLKAQVQNRNHVLLTGQRRMGKTSVLHELGHRLEDEGWVLLFADVEGAMSAEDAVAVLARAARPVQPIASRFAAGMKRWVGDSIEEMSAYEFSVKIRAGLNAGNWQHEGERLLHACASQKEPVLLVIDELPMFLKRMLREPDGERGVDKFLSWLRGVFQSGLRDSLVIIVSGSIGLAPLVQRIGLSDRINHLHPIRLAPWSREVSVACFQNLAESCNVRFDDGVAEVVYERLGIGIPHHVQSFFARLRDFATMRDRNSVAVEDVDFVYRHERLGASGQTDLFHYEERLKDALEEPGYSIAVKILAEAATQQVFSPEARRNLEKIEAKVTQNASRCIADTIEVLAHDGYLEANEDGYGFPSTLLKDWWEARYRDHHAPLRSICQTADPHRSRK